MPGCSGSILNHQFGVKFNSLPTMPWKTRTPPRANTPNMTHANTKSMTNPPDRRLVEAGAAADNIAPSTVQDTSRRIRPPAPSQIAEGVRVGGGVDGYGPTVAPPS